MCDSKISKSRWPTWQVLEIKKDDGKWCKMTSMMYSARWLTLHISDYLIVKKYIPEFSTLYLKLYTKSIFYWGGAGGTQFCVISELWRYTRIELPFIKEEAEIRNEVNCVCLKKWRYKNLGNLVWLDKLEVPLSQKHCLKLDWSYISSGFINTKRPIFFNKKDQQSFWFQQFLNVSLRCHCAWKNTPFFRPQTSHWSTDNHHRQWSSFMRIGIIWSSGQNVCLTTRSWLGSNPTQDWFFL